MKKLLLCRRFITYGTNRINLSREYHFDRRQENITNKPSSGLWACPIDAKYSWKDFASSFRSKKEFKRSVVFKLKMNAKILV